MKINTNQSQSKKITEHPGKTMPNKEKSTKHKKKIK